MRINHLETGKIVIDQDDDVLAKVEGLNIDDVDVSDMRINAESLAKLYQKAKVTDPRDEDEGFLDAFKRYAKMKQLYLDTFSA